MENPSKILVVDDEPDIRSLLEDFLRGVGYVVHAAPDGEEALHLLQREGFHGVLADLQLPKLGGLELLRAIKASHPTVPVIMLTGYPSVDVAVEAMKDGAADFITKPLRLDDLERVLKRVINGRVAQHPESASSHGSLSRLHTKIKELSILYSISEAFQSTTDIEGIFQRLVDVAREIVGAQCAAFTILDHDNHDLPLKTVQTCHTDDWHPAPCPLDERLLGQLLLQRQPLLLNHGPAAIVIPMLIKAELLGVLSVWANPEECPFTEDDLLLLVALCRKAALSIENQFLYESLYQSLLETLKALVTTLEAKDPYTRAHSQRVSQYATALAARMGCSQEEQDIVKVAGYLHDIGKVGICDAILLKPQRLTPAEYEQIKAHPVIGEQIVQNLGYFAREKVIIRHHHERWDGRGYPEGLLKDHTPFLARILTVADAYDAITTDRPYRAGKSSREALEELDLWAGIQFDRDVVVAFRHVIGSNCPRLAHHP